MFLLLELDFLGMDLLTVGFLEFVVFLHHLIHVAIIHIHIDYLFALFDRLVLFLEA